MKYKPNDKSQLRAFNFNHRHDRSRLKTEFFHLKEEDRIERPNHGFSFDETHTILTKCSKQAEHVIVPAGVTTIGRAAFYECGQLKEVCLPKGLQRIEAFAFNGCASLRRLVIPDTVNYIGPWAFADSDIDVVNIPEGVTEICEGTFWETPISNITLPDTLEHIRNNAFTYAFCIHALRCLPNLKTIGNGAFYGCPQLEKISIPDSLTTIGENAFKSCNLHLSVLELKNVVSVGKCAFMDNYGIRKVSISAKTTEIGEDAFDCQGLQEIIVDKDNPSFTAIDGRLYTRDLSNVIHEKQNPQEPNN